MNDYIFDWDKNSQDILNKCEYTTKKYRTKEQVMLIRYLRDRGYTFSQCYDIWMSKTPNISYKNNFLLDDIDVKQYFNMIWRMSKRASNKCGVPIKIYQSEIDFINNMVCSVWVKQYIFSMLCVYKYYNKEWVKYDNKIKTFCYSCTQTKKERKEKIKILKDVVEKYNLYDIRCKGSSVVYKMNFSESDSSDWIYQISNPRGIPDIISCVKSIKRCSLCGEDYEYDTRNLIGDICPKCCAKIKMSENRHKK